MKLFLFPLLFISMLSIGQNRDVLCYELINHKLNEDGLIKYTLSEQVAGIDSFDLEVMINVLNDSLTDIEALKTIKGLKNQNSKELFYKSNNVHAQMKESSGKWDLNQLHKKQKVYKKKWIKNSQYKYDYSLSKPVFFNDNKNALVLVGETFGGGYMEVYQRNEQGGWKKISRKMIWLGE